MTKQDYIRSLKAEISAIKRFVAMVVVLLTLVGAVYSVYKGVTFTVSAVTKAFEPTAAEEKAAAEKAAAEKVEAEKWNRLIEDCHKRSPVGWTHRNRYAFCYHQTIQKMKKLNK